MKILHIHQDYPDGRNYPFTLAVSNLINASTKCNDIIEHFVLSINRTSNPCNISSKRFAQGLSLIYWALPISLIYLPTLWLYALYVSRKLTNNDFDVIHAHTGTTEALLARYLSKKLNIPYVITARGGSDLHNIQRLPFEKNAFRKNFLEADHIFWVCKWFQPIAEDLLGHSFESKSSGLANICNIDNVEYDIEIVRDKKYFTVISFHQYKRKGIIPLIHAISEMKEAGCIVALDIFGTGPVDCVQAVQDAIQEHKLEEQVTIIGEIENKLLLEKMKEYKGLLLPSAKETLGMAYIEALATGNIILYHKRTGFDGFFESSPIGYAVENQTVSELKAALENLEASYDIYFTNVKKLQIQDDLRIFKAFHVATHYLDIISHLKVSESTW